MIYNLCVFGTKLHQVTQNEAEGHSLVLVFCQSAKLLTNNFINLGHGANQGVLVQHPGREGHEHFFDATAGDSFVGLKEMLSFGRFIFRF